MAAETVAELYYQLGLDTTKLDKGFIDAQKTVNQNVRIMNRQEALIKLKTDVAIQGLDENIDLTDALKIRQEELAQRLEITKDRVELTSAAYEQMTQSQGENSEAAQLLAIQLEKERLVMAQLERQTRELNEQQKIAIGVNYELLGLIEPAMKGLKGLAGGASTLAGHSLLHVQVATAAAMGLAAVIAGTKTATDELKDENIAKLLDSEFANAQVNISNSLQTINQETLRTARNMNQAFQYQAQREVTTEDYISDFLRLETILTDESDSLSQTLKNITGQTNYMNTELGKTIGLAIGVGKTFSALKKSAKQWATPALEGFKDLQLKAQEMKVSLPVANDIVNAITLANGDYDDVRDWVRGVQDAIIKGDAEDPESLALEKYGVAIQDAHGYLLPFNEALENMYQGFLKAKEAGEEEAYIIMTNGQSVHDVLPFLENYAAAKEKINSIQWSTSDYDGLNELSQNMKLAEIQANEFKTALSSLAIPFANYSAESDFDFFKTLTEIIEENRDTVLYWEFAFIEALKSVESLAGEAIDSIIETFNEFKESEAVKTITDFFDTLKKPEETIISIPFELIGVFKDSKKTDGIFDKILKNAQKKLDTYIDKNKKARKEIDETQKKSGEALTYSKRRITEFEDEIADIEIELKFGDNEYEKELARLDQWRDKALRNAKYYQKEQDVIQKEYWLKRQQIVEKHLDEIERIEREQAERIRELDEETASIGYEITHSALDKQLKDIRDWRDKSIAAIKDRSNAFQETAAINANALAKEAQVLKQKMDEMRGIVQSSEEEYFKLTHSQYENDLLDLQKKRDERIKNGDPNAVRNYEIEKAKLEYDHRKDKDYWQQGNFLKYYLQNQNQNPNKFKISYGAETAENLPVARPKGGTPQKTFTPRPLEGDLEDSIKNTNNYYDFAIRQLRDKQLSDEELQKQEAELNEQRKSQIERMQNDFAESLRNWELQRTQAETSGAEPIRISYGDQDEQPQLYTTDQNLNADLQNIIDSKTNDADNIKSFVDAQRENAAKEAERFNEWLSLYREKVDGQITAINEVRDNLPQSNGAKIPPANNVEKPANSQNIPNNTSDKNSNSQTPNAAPQPVSNSDLTVTLQKLVTVNETNLPKILTSLQPLTKLNALDELSKITAALAPLNKISSEFTRYAGSIAQKVNQKQQSQPPQINVTVSPNINLGGAYVFDNAMKLQLTNDITTDVADGVKSAVNQALQDFNWV